MWGLALITAAIAAEPNAPEGGALGPLPGLPSIAAVCDRFSEQISSKFDEIAKAVGENLGDAPAPKPFADSKPEMPEEMLLYLHKPAESEMLLGFVQIEGMRGARPADWANRCVQNLVVCNISCDSLRWPAYG